MRGGRPACSGDAGADNSRYIVAWSRAVASSHPRAAQVTARSALRSSRGAHTGTPRGGAPGRVAECGEAEWQSTESGEWPWTQRVVHQASWLGSFHLETYRYLHTGWSINNRTILNCSHFVARRYFFNPFSPKRNIHTGKLPQQHEFANASFVILFRCQIVSPYHVDGSANNVSVSRRSFLWNCWGTCAYNFVASSARTGEHLALSQTLSQNFMARRIKTFREEGRILKRSPTGRTPTVTTDEKRRILKLCPAEPQVLRWRLRELLSVQAEPAKIQCAFTLTIFQKWRPRHRTLFAEPPNCKVKQCDTKPE